MRTKKILFELSSIFDTTLFVSLARTNALQSLKWIKKEKEMIFSTRVSRSNGQKAVKLIVSVFMQF